MSLTEDAIECCITQPPEPIGKACLETRHVRTRLFYTLASTQYLQREISKPGFFLKPHALGFRVSLEPHTI